MIINRIFKKRYLLQVVQFFTLFVFLLLIYGAISATTGDTDFAKILRNTNLSNLIVWSYWWPIIIVTAILLGRFWCSICPMELVTSFAGKIGLRKKPGTLLRSGWVMTFFYMTILVLGIHTFAIHRIPMYMSIYMIILFAVALVSGFIWEKRTFCTHICPVGHLLGLYSLLSFKKLRVKNKAVCDKCTTKDCIKRNSHYKFTNRSCTSELYPAKISDNRQCILCGQCFKSCSKDNIAIKGRKFAADLFSNIKLSWAEMGFFMIVSGFVIYEVLSEWPVSKKIVMAIPNWINNSFGISGEIKGTIKATLLFVLIPALFYSAIAFFKKIFAKETLSRSFSQIAIALLPITASMHLLKAILKTTSRIPYWKFSLANPDGIESAKNILNKSILLNKKVVTIITPVVSLCAFFLILTAFLFSLYISFRQEHKNPVSRLATITASICYSGIFIVTILSWRIF